MRKKIVMQIIFPLVIVSKENYKIIVGNFSNEINIKWVNTLFWDNPFEIWSNGGVAGGESSNLESGIFLHFFLTFHQFLNTSIFISNCSFDFLHFSLDFSIH